MITVDKLSDVAKAAEAITAAVEMVDVLLADEPIQQPPTPRRVALTKIAQTLERKRGELESLWS